MKGKTSFCLLAATIILGACAAPPRHAVPGEKLPDVAFVSLADAVKAAPRIKKNRPAVSSALPFNPHGVWDFALKGGVDDVSAYPGMRTVLARGTPIPLASLALNPSAAELVPAALDIGFDPAQGNAEFFFQGLNVFIPIDPKTLSGQVSLESVSASTLTAHCAENIDLEVSAAFRDALSLNVTLKEIVSFRSTGRGENCADYLQSVQDQLLVGQAPANWTQLYNSGGIQKTGLTSLVSTTYAFHYAAAWRSPLPQPALLTANVVDPNDVNAVSLFHSCAGHPYPELNSRNSAKNYFWPNSSNFNSTGKIKEYAACAGTAVQTNNDLSDNETVRGRSLHLLCDRSTTRLRYFHISFDSAAVLNQHFNAGDFLGYAVTLSSQAPGASAAISTAAVVSQSTDSTVAQSSGSAVAASSGSAVAQSSAAAVSASAESSPTIWQNSSNFDVAVSDGDDDSTADYFTKLAPSALAAWKSRGVTDVSLTLLPAGNSCAGGFKDGVGDPGVFSFSPSN